MICLCFKLFGLLIDGGGGPGSDFFIGGGGGCLCYYCLCYSYYFYGWVFSFLSFIKLAYGIGYSYG